MFTYFLAASRPSMLKLVLAGFGDPERRLKYSFHTQPQEGKNMGVIWTVVLGLVIGLIAKLIHPARKTWALS